MGKPKLFPDGGHAAHPPGQASAIADFLTGYAQFDRPDTLPAP